MNQKPIIVFYHTTSPELLHPMPADVYPRICRRFVEMCHKWDLTVVHLSVDINELYGDSKHCFFGDPRNIVYNREICFRDFLKYHALPQRQYLFCEPDMVIKQMFPLLPEHADMALLYRHDHKPHLAAAWRFAKTSALPFFEETARLAEFQRKDWHGDSEVFNQIYTEMFPINKPAMYDIVYPWKTLNIQLRAYEDYVKWRYTYMHHYTAERKMDLLASDPNA